MKAVFFGLLLANVAMLVMHAMPMTRDGVEPERLAQQLHPEKIRVIDPETAAAQAVQERLAAHRAAQEKQAQQAQEAQQAPQAPQGDAAAAPQAGGPAPNGAAPAPASNPAVAPAAAAHPAGAAAPANTPPSAASSSPPAGDTALAQAVCVELGDFTAQASESFEPQLSRLSMTGIPQRRVIQPPPSYLVFLPPLPTESAASRRLAEVRQKGFADSAVMRDDTPRRWGISAGLFSKEDLAIAHLDKLHKAGFAEARMGEHPLNSTRYAYRLPGVTAAGATRLAAVASGYAGVSMRPCK